MTKILLILFLIGHVLGDYYFQSDNLAEAKEKSFPDLLKHSVIYLFSILLVIIPVFSLNVLKWALIIVAAHFSIDLIKSFIKKKIRFSKKIELDEDKSDLALYIIDQLLHILVIILLITAMEARSEPISFLSGLENVLNNTSLNVLNILSWILVILIIIKPSSLTIAKVLNIFKPLDNEENEGHPNAGSLIGILERFTIILLLSVGQYAAIGFVLTAKSIARYNKIVEDPMFSEYYLLGTLLSALLAIGSYMLIF